MPQMGLTAAAYYLGAVHEPTSVLPLGDDVVVYRQVKTGPTSAGIELSIGVEQLGIAADAAIDPGRLTVMIIAGKCWFGAFFAGDPILLPGQFLTPFVVGKGDAFLTHNPSLAIVRGFVIQNSRCGSSPGCTRLSMKMELSEYRYLKKPLSR